MQPTPNTYRETQQIALYKSAYALLLLCCLAVAGCSSTAGNVSTPPTLGNSRPATSTLPVTLGFSAIKTPLLTFTGHARSVTGVVWSPDGQSVASSGKDGLIQSWNPKTGVLRWSRHIAPLALAVAWSPDGKWVAGAGSAPTSTVGIGVTLLNATTGQIMTTLHDNQSTIIGLAWSSDSTLIASGSQDGIIMLWDVASGQAKHTFTTPHIGIEQVAWSPDGRTIASAGYDGIVRVWDVRTGAVVSTYPNQMAPIWSVAWSPNGKEIVSGTGAAIMFPQVAAHNSVHIWNAATGQMRINYPGQRGQVFAVAWSHSGATIASGGEDTSAQIWNAATGKSIVGFLGHMNTIWSVSWSPDDKELATASEDGTVKIWQLPA